MQPRPAKDPKSPETEIYYASRFRATLSLGFGGIAVFLTTWYLVSEGPHNAVFRAIAGFFLLMGGYAVIFELRAYFRPKSHSLILAPEGLTLTSSGRPIVYPWAEISNFEIADRGWKKGEKNAMIESPRIAFDMEGREKKIFIDELYGWQPDDLVAHLHYKRRKFLKKAKSQDKE